MALVRHTPPASQHPLGHEVASQTQAVPLQRCPEGHITHATPPAPHAAGSSVVMQVVPLQHPFAHDVPSHTQVVPLQRCPDPHITHATPPAPHAAGSSVVTQVAPLQHPFAHEAALHTQAPAALHC